MLNIHEFCELVMQNVPLPLVTSLPFHSIKCLELHLNSALISKIW